MRNQILAAALSLLMLPATSAFADSEGGYQPTTVASPASGMSAAPAMPNVDYSQGEGAQAEARPVAAVRNVTHGPRAAARVSSDFNLGLNG